MNRQPMRLFFLLPVLALMACSIVASAAEWEIVYELQHASNLTIDHTHGRLYAVGNHELHIMDLPSGQWLSHEYGGYEHNSPGLA